MVSSTVSVDVFRDLQLGHPSFRILAKEASGQITHRYLVSVPKALMRSGLFGIVSNAVLAVSGKATKFGRSVFHALDGLDGIEPALDNDTPHVLTVYVHTTPQTDPAFEDFPSLYRGLPMSVCCAIEKAIRANRGPLQVIAEYLRRLF